MLAVVTFLTSSGSLVRMLPGDAVGRVPSAVMMIDDPRISEYHAYVSLRGASLRLIALRGRLSMDGKPRTEIELTVGQRLVIAGYYPLEVVAVELPDRALALACQREGASDLDHVVAQGTLSFFDNEEEPVRYGFNTEALAVFWSGAEGVVLRTLDPPTDRQLELGDRFVVGRHRYQLVSVPITLVESAPTLDRGGIEMALRLRIFYDAVHVSADTNRMVILTGIAAIALSELAEIGQPVSWRELARQLWPEAADEAARWRWDQLMGRIRAKLREAGLRSDLIRPTGAGLVQLVLGPRDLLEWGHEDKA